VATYPLMYMQISRTGMEQVEDVTELNVFLNDIHVHVEESTHVSRLLIGLKRPHALKFCIM
jgi:hypothetical protein